MECTQLGRCSVREYRRGPTVENYLQEFRGKESVVLENIKHHTDDGKLTRITYLYFLMVVS
ncbi:unnamed protein product [Acanthoscelides obtectus]|uniref:Uncharacterized protein n=1 Tax=Acanthoscelides obtectus TaxID=200917 RepID=A0A9P0LZC7_ACAOB|nr:unnamed protein product [Acanthoscelides obtectus]CAK1638686.1 hypothetical protein AOBTE_LOCUS10760 [Acanthoscelides obtectus]